MKSSKDIEIMAIINTSPDSFAGDGVSASDETVLRTTVQKALANGADILDIGGQSTRPGADIISPQEEIDRVIPAINLARQLTDKTISIDTFKPEVARAALEAGANMVNDVRGMSDPQMVKVVQEAGCQVVIMHSRGDPKSMGGMTDYPKGVVVEVQEFLRERTQKLIAAGIAKENIIVDPGIGFAKTAAQSFALTHDLDKIAELGFPVLYGASQKSFLGKVLGSETQPASLKERTVGTVIVQAHAMMHGASIVRVHDVKSAFQTRIIINTLRRN
jgi:dihydropteroate synthase